MKKSKAAAYCRVSTDSDEQASSLESQVVFFRDYISSRSDWELYKVYYDEGISGTSMQKREQFNQMISDGKMGLFDYIITKEVSRFARNTVDALTVVRALKERGIGVIFMNDGINTLDSEGELRLTIMSGIAQEESRKTSERVKWGQKRRMEKGVVFGHDLLGYTVQNGRLIINAVEAEIVRIIYRKYLIEEKGCGTIAKELYNEGIYPKHSKQWSPSVILRILRNEKYAGDLCQKKTFTPNFLNHKKKYNHGEEDKIYISDHHEPIIDRSQWERVQSRLEERSSHTKNANRYWCSGRLICGQCGKSFISRTKKRADGSVYRSWRCYSSAQGKSCDCGTVNDMVLLSAVGYVLNKIDLDKIKVEQDIVKDILSVDLESQVDVSMLLNRTKRIKQKKLMLIDSMAEGIISKDEMKQQKAHYDKELSALEFQLSKAQEQNKNIDNQTQQKLCKEVRRILNFDNSAEQLFHEVLDKIIIHKNNILEVYIKAIPNAFMLEYNTCGRGQGYHAQINQISTEDL